MSSLVSKDSTDIKTLDDFVSLQRGTTYKGPLVGEPGPALLGLGSIEPGGGFREGHYKTYGGDCPANLMLFPGDLYVSLKGATKDGTMIGSVARVPETVSSGRLTQDTVKLEFRNSDPEEVNYLYWVLRTPQYRTYCANRATGSAVVALSRQDFLDYPVPPRNSTRKNLGLFEGIDRKISNLHQQNETLESIAQTLFKHWFVDFEFPNEDGKPYKSSGGAMVRSDLGDIPVGWTFGKMEDVIEVRDGTHDSPKQTDIGFYLITSKHLKKGSIDFESAYLISESDYVEVNKRSKVDTYDILLSMIGTIGLLCFVMDEKINFAIKNIGLFKTSKNLDYAEYIFLSLSSTYGSEYFRTRLAGTTQSYLTLRSLREMPLIVPNKEVLLGFKKVAKAIFRKSHAHKQQIQTLTQTRDRLLPKLMSGQLRIPE